ncbi:MAG: hypothetical protein ABSE35_14160 [Bryobacteraceae bacterium]|jgi:hypothetical protein
MYAPNMWERFRGAPVVVMAAWSLASCDTPARSAAVPAPEAEQVVSAALKKLYMAASAAPPQSAAQQKVILQMAEKASNGKELLLVMRAAVGVFPPGTGSQEPSAQSKVRSVVTAKMMELGTLDQLIECAMQYSVNPESARPFVQRMFQLGDEKSDPRVWYRIRVAASRLKVGDLERQAQTRGDQLAGR